MLTSSVETAGSDGELLVGAGDTSESEALVVVVSVGVGGHLGAGTEVAAGPDGGGVDLSGSVVLAAAGGSSTGLDLDRDGADGHRKGEEEGGEGQLHLGGRQMAGEQRRMDE